MIAAAERAASESGLSNSRFEVASADRLPFSTDSFDAVVSRFGVMFFPSPIDGGREVLRVLKPKRRLAFAVWSVPEKNPFHSVFVAPTGRFPRNPYRSIRLTLRFATPHKLLNVLNEAEPTQTNESSTSTSRHRYPPSIDSISGPPPNPRSERRIGSVIFGSVVLGRRQ